MLHDLYLLSCYFDPTQAVLFEEDLNRRYGLAAVTEALKEGWIELCCMPCRQGNQRRWCRLTHVGIRKIESAQGAIRPA